MSVIPYDVVKIKVKCNVYAHLHPITKEPFYIGCGYGGRAHDFTQRTHKWKEYNRQLQKNGMIFEVKILHVCDTWEEGAKLEKQEIKKAIKAGFLLTNHSHTKIRKKIFKKSNRIGVKLKELRKSRRLTQGQLAKKSGIPQTSISKIEVGAICPTFNTVYKVVSAMNMDIIIK